MTTALTLFEEAESGKPGAIGRWTAYASGFETRAPGGMNSSRARRSRFSGRGHTRRKAPPRPINGRARLESALQQRGVVTDPEQIAKLRPEQIETQVRKNPAMPRHYAKMISERAHQLGRTDLVACWRHRSGFGFGS
jgi:hypothetical protein